MAKYQNNPKASAHNPLPRAHACAPALPSREVASPGLSCLEQTLSVWLSLFFPGGCVLQRDGCAHGEEIRQARRRAGAAAGGAGGGAGRARATAAASACESGAYSCACAKATAEAEAGCCRAGHPRRLPAEQGAVAPTGAPLLSRHIARLYWLSFLLTLIPLATAGG